MDHLQVGGHIAQHAEHGQAQDDAGKGSQGHVAVLEEAHRDERFGSAQFHDGGNDRADEGDGAEGEDHGGIPVILGAAPGGHEDKGGGGNGDEGGAEPVKALHIGLTHTQVEYQDADHHGQQAERDIHPHAPAPAGAISKPAAQDGAKDGGQAEDAAHDAHELATLTGGGDLGDDGL